MSCGYATNVSGSSCVTVDVGPACVHLVRVRAGDQTTLTVTLLAGSAQTPWDLTGAVVSAQARAAPSDIAPALTADVTIIDASAGQVLLVWNGDDIHDLFADEAPDVDMWQGVWDMQVLPAGDPLPRTVVAGNFVAQRDVTR